MPRRKNTEATANTDATDQDVTDEAEYQTGQDFDAASGEADPDFDNRDQNDPFYGKFMVEAKLVENAAARTFHDSDTVRFEVTRWGVRKYTARCYIGTGEDARIFKGGDSRNPSKAIKNVIAAMSQREKEYGFDAEAAEKEQAPVPEKAGDNKPDAFIWQDTTTDTGKALAAVAERMAPIEALYSDAEASTRAGELGIGALYNELRSIYAGAGVKITSERSDDEAVKQSNAEWGAFLTRYAKNLPHVFDVLNTPGKRSRCGFYASAPTYIVEAMPTVNTASTFERKVNEAVSGVANANDRPGFAYEAIVKLFAEKDADAAEGEVPVATTRELWEAAVMKHEANLERVAKTRTAWEAAADKAKKAGNSQPAFADRLAEVENMIIGWLLGDVSPTDEEGRTARAAAFEGTKLHLAMRAEWEAEVAASKPKSDEEVEAENTATKKRTKEAAAEQSKGIALMSVSEAAEVVANTIMAHGEPMAIAEALLEVVKSRLEAKAAAAAAAKEKANAQDAAA